MDKKHITIMLAVAAMHCAMSLEGFAAPEDKAEKHITLKEVEIIGVKSGITADAEAVTQLDSAAISHARIKTLQNLGEIAPNFYMPQYGSRMTSSIYVRGLGARIDNPVVGYSVDNVPIFNKNNFDFDLIDIDRIDVFRGPQAVLAGRNTMAGQVNVYTLSPWKYTGVKAMAEYGSHASFKASATASGKISEKVASSLSAYYTTRNGYWRNSFNNSRVGDENQVSARWKLAVRPTAWHSITNTASFTHSRQKGYPYSSIETGQINYNDTCFYRRNSFSDGLTAVWAGKRVVVTSATSFQYLDDNMTLDQDFLPADYFTLTQKQREWVLTQDLYAKGSRGKYRWTAGVFGFFRRNSMDAPVTFHKTGINGLIMRGYNMIHKDAPIKWNSDSFILGSKFRTPTRGIAVYQDSNYDLYNISFNFGLRYSYESSTMFYDNDCSTSYTKILPPPPTPVPVEIHNHGKLSLHSSRFLPRASVTWHIPQIFGELFFNYSQGYKAGGFNTQMFSDILQQELMKDMGLSHGGYDVDKTVKYKPEYSHNYEIGLKGDVFDGLISYGFTGFFIDCRDQQITRFPDNMTTGRMMSNAGRTYSRGFESEIVFRPNPDMSFRASYGYTHATFRKYHDGKTSYKGKRVPFAPESTLYISGYYRLPVSFAGFTPSVSANVRGTGDIYWDEANTVRQNFYALMGASISFDSRHFSINLWADNITQTKYNSFYFVSMRNAFVQKGTPRMAGISLRYTL